MRTAYQNIKGAAAAAGDRDFLTNPSSPPTIIAQQSCTPAAPLRPAEAGLVRPSPVVHRRQAQRSGPRDLRSHEPPISTPQLLLVPVLAHGDPSPPPLLLFQAHHGHGTGTQFMGKKSFPRLGAGERGCRGHRNGGARELCSLASLGEGEGTEQMLQLPERRHSSGVNR